jgi:hypothetical protein
MVGSDRRLYHTWQNSPSSSNEWYHQWAPLHGVFFEVVVIVISERVKNKESQTCYLDKL